MGHGYNGKIDRHRRTLSFHTVMAAARHETIDLALERL